MSDPKDERRRGAWARFRFSVVGPLLAAPPKRGDLRGELTRLSQKTWRHPVTGESVWFNHIAFWHVSSLEPQLREAMMALFGEENLAYNTYYGDGTRIEDSIIAEINEAYRQETIAFPWQHGDIMMLDNMLVAHGRSPFVGPRKVLVAMGEAHTRSDF